MSGSRSLGRPRMSVWTPASMPASTQGLSAVRPRIRRFHPAAGRHVQVAPLRLLQKRAAGHDLQQAAAHQGDHRSGCQASEKGVIGPECRFGGRGDIRGAVAQGTAVDQARVAAVTFRPLPPFSTNSQLTSSAYPPSIRSPSKILPLT